MGKSIHLLTLEAQRDYGWTFAFANAYVCVRHIEGLSHQRAFDQAMRSTYVAERDKPRRW